MKSTNKKYSIKYFSINIFKTFTQNIPYPDTFYYYEEVFQFYLFTVPYDYLNFIIVKVVCFVTTNNYKTIY